MGQLVEKMMHSAGPVITDAGRSLPVIINPDLGILLQEISHTWADAAAAALHSHPRLCRDFFLFFTAFMSFLRQLPSSMSQELMVCH